MNDIEFTAIIDIVRANKSKFRGDFLDWMADNGHVYLAFEERANRLWDCGRTHFGAKSIVEHIRFDTAISEVGGEFKVNNTFTSSMARLYALLNPSRASLFTLRASEIRCAA